MSRATFYPGDTDLVGLDKMFRSPAEDITNVRALTGTSISFHFLFTYIVKLRYISFGAGAALSLTVPAPAPSKMPGRLRPLTRRGYDSLFFTRFNSGSESRDLTQLITHNGFTRIDSNQVMTQWLESTINFVDFFGLSVNFVDLFWDFT